jgi:hypothetical protein
MSRSTKAILLRFVREKGCKPSHEAQAVLARYPDAWKAAAAALADVAAPGAENQFVEAA